MSKPLGQRSIVFTDPANIRGIFAGTKTQTRRAINAGTLRVVLPDVVTADMFPWETEPSVVAQPGRYHARLNQHGAVTIRVGTSDLGVRPGEFNFVCPYTRGETMLDAARTTGRWTLAGGIRLWVKEPWAGVPWSAGAEKHCPDQDHDNQGVRYAATWDRSHRSWRSARFMPRWAGRLEIDVASVRIEKLQDICEEDAIAEGCSSILAFRELWTTINGEKSWTDNPWTWAITFARACG